MFSFVTVSFPVGFRLLAIRSPFYATAAAQLYPPVASYSSPSSCRTSRRSDFLWSLKQPRVDKLKRVGDGAHTIPLSVISVKLCEPHFGQAAADRRTEYLHAGDITPWNTFARQRYHAPSGRRLPARSALSVKGGSPG